MRKTIVVMVVICSLALVAVPARAVSLSLSPASQTVSVGGTAWVDLVVGGLGDSTSPSLAGFDVDVTYDSLILTIDPYAVLFGAFLGDISFFEADASATGGEASGVVNVYELSFLAADELDALQPASFTLAKLPFLANGPGTSGLGYGEMVSLSDVFGYVFELDTTGGSVAAGGGGVPVPEPSCLLSLGLVLIGLAGLKKKKFNRSQR